MFPIIPLILDLDFPGGPSGDFAFFAILGRILPKMLMLWHFFLLNLVLCCKCQLCTKFYITIASFFRELWISELSEKSQKKVTTLTGSAIMKFWLFVKFLIGSLNQSIYFWVITKNRTQKPFFYNVLCYFENIAYFPRFRSIFGILENCLWRHDWNSGNFEKTNLQACSLSYKLSLCQISWKNA